jgi:hypothetical protein
MKSRLAPLVLRRLGKGGFAFGPGLPDIHNEYIDLSIEEQDLFELACIEFLLFAFDDCAVCVDSLAPRFIKRHPQLLSSISYYVLERDV